MNVYGFFIVSFFADFPNTVILVLKNASVLVRGSTPLAPGSVVKSLKVKLIEKNKNEYVIEAYFSPISPPKTTGLIAPVIRVSEVFMIPLRQLDYD